MKEGKNIKAAIKEFFTAEYNKLVNYVRGYLDYISYSVDAEDIIQDVALNIYSRVHISEPVENLGAYIYRSIKNKIIDIRRKNMKNSKIEYMEGVINEKSVADSISEEEEDHFYKDEYMYERMYDALEQLKPKDRDIIVETEFKGRSFNDLSGEWDIPVGTLLARKHRALSKLQDIMKDERNNYKS
jgi:RNA polymerase sigma factor (sigma-70 family)